MSGQRTQSEQERPTQLNDMRNEYESVRSITEFKLILIAVPVSITFSETSSKPHFMGEDNNILWTIPFNH